MATSPHTSSEGNPSNKGRPKVADCLKKVGDPAHSPEKRRYPNLSSHLGPGRTLRAFPLGAVEAENSRYPNLSTRRHSAGIPTAEGLRGPNPGSGYENAASLVFLPCFSPADSQNALSQSEGRDVLEENKRILPPILSRGVAFPSQIQQTGSNGVKRIHTRPLLAEKSQPGRTHDRLCRDRSVPRLSPPDSGTLPRLHGLYNLPPPVACTWREDTVGGPPRGETSSPGMCSEGWAPQSPWTAFSAVSGESGCNKSTNFQQDWRSQTKISRCTDWYYQSVHTSPQSSGPSTIFSSRATKRSPVCPPSGRERAAGGNLVSASIQQYIDSRENDEPPSRLHSTLEDDAPITRLSAVGG